MNVNAFKYANVEGRKQRRKKTTKYGGGEKRGKGKMKNF